MYFVLNNNNNKNVALVLEGLKIFIIAIHNISMFLQFCIKPVRKLCL